MTDSYRLWVGIGCNRGTPCDTIAAAVTHVFAAHGLVEAAIATIGTIDHKVAEVGLVEFCRDRHLPLRFFSAAVLRAVTVPHPSAIASHAVGTTSVAEAAAILAYQDWIQGIPTRTASIAPDPSADCDASIPVVSQAASFTPPMPLLVPKQIFRLHPHLGAVTLAVAGDPQYFSGWVQGLKVYK